MGVCVCVCVCARVGGASVCLLVCVCVCVWGVPPFVCLSFGQDDQSDSSSMEDLAYPHISYWDDGSVYLAMSQDFHIPLEAKPGMQGKFVLLRAPSGEYYVDTDNQDPKWKPKYVSHLERRYHERPLCCVLLFCC